jgi:hypothetical protein
LLVLILLGLGLSGAALVFLGAFFSWLSLGTPYAWDLEPRPSQEAQFGIVRNAVTAGAALGLGVTLLLSYRRQRTNEQSQEIAARALRISATAQETAAEALQLANKQHQLDVDRRHDDSVRELHTRYGRAAEQLAHGEVAVRLAGVHAVTALADDWYFHHEADQRQACLDLLCSYYRIPAKDTDRQDLDVPVRETIWSSVISRLAADCPEPRSWSSSKFNFRQLQDAPARLADVLIRDGQLDFSGSNFPVGLNSLGSVILSGALDLSDIRVDHGGVQFWGLRLAGGRLHAGFATNSPVQTLKFKECEFDGGRLILNTGLAQVDFIECIFDGSELDFRMAWSLTKAKFINCRFEVDVMSQRLDDKEPAEWLRGVELVVRDCSYADGIPELFSRQGQTAHDSVISNAPA